MKTFLEALNESPLDDNEKEAVGNLYSTIQSSSDDDIEKEASEPPSLVEFETLNSTNNNDITISDEGRQITQILPDGTEVITLQ